MNKIIAVLACLALLALQTTAFRAKAVAYELDKDDLDIQEDEVRSSHC